MLLERLGRENLAACLNGEKKSGGLAAPAEEWEGCSATSFEASLVPNTYLSLSVSYVRHSDILACRMLGAPMGPSGPGLCHNGHAPSASMELVSAMKI